MPQGSGWTFTYMRAEAPMNNKWNRPFVMMLASLLGALSLFLSGCASSPERVQTPVTDLQLLKLGVDKLTQPRPVAGKVQRAYQAENNGELMDYALNLEDAKFGDEWDKRRIREFVSEAVVVMARARQVPCRFWQLRCKREQAVQLRRLQPP